MKILVVGKGGREHAIAWKLSQSSRVEKIYCAPGNGGISEIAECVPVDVMDTDGIIAAAREKAVDLVFVSPDDPLAAGMVDELERAGIRAFGPSRSAALIESSKAFAKDLMKHYGIPTARYEIFTDSRAALEYLKKCSFPVVVKADGLALGKGVIIASDFDEAERAVKDIMEDRVFGDAGKSVVIEEFLSGREATVLAFTDGKTVVPMVSSQDFKRALDNDRGLNTGGMGAVSPNCYYTPEIAERCMEEIFKPTIRALAQEGRKFKGVLYFGLMITAEGPKVIEYNARFGDPETQVVLPRLKTDLVDIIEAVIDERLDEIDLQWDDNAAACVILASGGYPGKYEKGFPIEGIPQALEAGALVFHSGTTRRNGTYYTDGGRVLGVTATGENLDIAINRAYEYAGMIKFDKMHYRKDIGRA